MGYDLLAQDSKIQGMIDWANGNDRTDVMLIAIDYRIRELDDLVPQHVPGWNKEIGDASPTANPLAAMLLLKRTLSSFPDGHLVLDSFLVPPPGETVVPVHRVASAVFSHRHLTFLTKNEIQTIEHAIVCVCLAVWGADEDHIYNIYQSWLNQHLELKGT